MSAPNDDTLRASAPAGLCCWTGGARRCPRQATHRLTDRLIPDHLNLYCEAHANAEWSSAVHPWGRVEALPGVTESITLAAEVLRLRAERIATGNLLAVIHRDGGHHMAEHGVQASCAAAERVVCDERARLDAVEHAARAYRDATDVLIGAWAVRDGTRTEHWIKAELSRVEAAEAQAKARTELDRVLGGGR